MKHGTRPLRTPIDPSRDGSVVVGAVADRFRADFSRRIGLDMLLTTTSSLSHPTEKELAAMPFANFKVPEKTLTPKQKEEIVTRTTELYVEIYGERARTNTMVLIEEVTDGGWGISGSVLTLAMLGEAAAANTSEA